MTRPTQLAFYALFLGLAACPAPDDTGADSDTDDTPAPGELAQSDLARETNPSVQESDLGAFTEDNRAFAFAMYHQLAATPGNLFFSPHSISSALAMTYAGANGDTEAQIAEALRFDLPEAQLHPSFNRLDLALTSRAEAALPSDEDGDPFQLSVVNATWAQHGYPLHAAWLDTLAVNYGAGVHLLDFGADPDGSREAINDWVEDVTNDKIVDLLPPGSITGDTKLVLTNAIYFKASWKEPFDASNTTADPFTPLGGAAVNVPTMHGAIETSFYDADGYALVDLPYLGDQLAMTLLVPDAGRFAEVEAALDQASFDAALAEARGHRVTLALPKFSFRTPLDLTDPLQQLGMIDAFSASDADFSGITDASRLFVGGVIHQAFVDVNEQGTEAAAATAVTFEDTSVPEEATLTVDRPFLFLIRDLPTGAILFVGRVTDPR